MRNRGIQTPRRPIRRGSTITAALVASVALVAGCQSGGDPAAEDDSRSGGSAENGAEAAEPDPDPMATVAISPDEGDSDVALDAPVTVTSQQGVLQEVTVAEVDDSDDGDTQVENASVSDSERDDEADGDGDGASQEPDAETVIDGSFNDAETRWANDGGLAPETSYEVQAIAVDENGNTTSERRRFDTMAVDTVLGTEIYPDGETVGVGHPLVVDFSMPVPDDAKADVERALEVEATNEIEGAWHWFADDTVHYRPKEYWPAHTDVTVRINLQGVDVGDGVWGIKNKVKQFSIGRSVVSKLDLNDHTQEVFIDGEHAKTIPITAGQPGWETRSGTKVVLEKRTDITLRSETIGVEDEDSEHYYNMFAPYALRVTWSGEFHHSADWSTWAHGNSNVSHGCVGMSIADSEWLWEQSQVGDVVEVSGSDTPMDISGNGYGDWNLSWDEWLEGSAL